METFQRWLKHRSVLFWLVAALAGCGPPAIAPRAAFDYTRTWQIPDPQSPFALVATLSPQPLVADRPAMLEVRIKAENLQSTPQRRVWYRFAQRRGDLLRNANSLVPAPQSEPEEGLEVRYEDWFEWAEIVEPRSENGEAIFTTPVMFSSGRVYVQFRVAAASELQPRELLDWFVYVD